MRGYQKKVICMKNTGSSLFEEAYFIVKSDSGSSAAGSAEMVNEANRIIKENFDNKKNRFILFHKRNVFSFFIGAAISLALCLLVYFLTR